MMNDSKLYVGHILNEISVLERILQQSTFQNFQSDSISFRAAVYAIQCISEASRKLPAEWLREFPEIRWRDIRGIGNHTRHEYANLRAFMIWDIMVDHLPALKAAIMQLDQK